MYKTAWIVFLYSLYYNGKKDSLVFVSEYLNDDENWHVCSRGF